MAGLAQARHGVLSSSIAETERRFFQREPTRGCPANFEIPFDRRIGWARALRAPCPPFFRSA